MPTWYNRLWWLQGHPSPTPQARRWEAWHGMEMPCNGINYQDCPSVGAGSQWSDVQGPGLTRDLHTLGLTRITSILTHFFLTPPWVPPSSRNSLQLVCVQTPQGRNIAICGHRDGLDSLIGKPLHPGEANLVSNSLAERETERALWFNTVIPVLVTALPNVAKNLWRYSGPFLKGQRPKRGFPSRI